MFAGSGAIVRVEKRIARLLREAGAVSPESARSPSELGIHRGLAFRILRRRDVVREVGEDRFYLDEQGWDAFEERRRRLATTLVTIVLLALAILFLVFSRR